MKSRGVYETPGGTILLAAHRAIESITLDRGAAHLKDELMPRYAELIYNGFWFAPEREMLQALIDRSQQDVEGTVRLKLYKGNVMVTGRKSPKTLYSDALVTFEDDRGAYDQKDAEGFIRLNALQAAHARRQKPQEIGGGDAQRPRRNDPGHHLMSQMSRLVLMFPGLRADPRRGALPALPARSGKVRAGLRHDHRAGRPFAAEERSQTSIGTGSFTVAAAGEGWSATTEVVIYGLGELNEDYAARNPVRRARQRAGGARRFRRHRNLLPLSLDQLALWVLLHLPAARADRRRARGMDRLAGRRGAGCRSAGACRLDRGAVRLPAGARLRGKTAAFPAGHGRLGVRARPGARPATRSSSRRLALLSADVRRRIGETAAAEIVFSAHSFGAVAAVIVLAEALDGQAAPARARA